MLKNQKFKYILIVVLGVVCYAFGRWQAPEKVKIEKEVVYKEDTSKIEKLQIELEKQKKKKTTIVRTVKPDGTVEEKIIVKEDESTKKKTDKEKNETTKKELTEKETKEITNSTSILTLSALVGTDFTTLFKPENGLIKPVFGGHIQRTFLGPITLGVFGLSNGTAGFSLGLTIK